MRDDAAVDAHGTQSTAPVPDGGESSHAAEMQTSTAVEDDGTGKLKAGDEAPVEVVADEEATPAQGAGCAAADEPEGGVAGDNPEPGGRPGGRRSSKLVQRVKQQGRTRKVAVMRLSPYRSPTHRRYSCRRRQGGVSFEGRRGRVLNVPADPSTARTDDVLDVAPIAAVTAEMKTTPTSSQEAPPEVREACRKM